MRKATNRLLLTSTVGDQSEIYNLAPENRGLTETLRAQKRQAKYRENSIRK